MTAGCDHKFVDSTSCIKCGWTPPLLNIVRVETEPPDYQADVIMGVGYFRMPSEEAMSDDLQASKAWQDVKARVLALFNVYGGEDSLVQQMLEVIERARAADAQQIAALRAENELLVSKKQKAPASQGQSPTGNPQSTDDLGTTATEPFPDQGRTREVVALDHKDASLLIITELQSQLTALQAEQAQWQQIDVVQPQDGQQCLVWRPWPGRVACTVFEKRQVGWTWEGLYGWEPSHWMLVPKTPKELAALTAQQDTPR